MEGYFKLVNLYLKNLNVFSLKPIAQNKKGGGQNKNLKKCVMEMIVVAVKSSSCRFRKARTLQI